jgi:hypothetical protein
VIAEADFRTFGAIFYESITILEFGIPYRKFSVATSTLPRIALGKIKLGRYELMIKWLRSGEVRKKADLEAG